MTPVREKCTTGLLTSPGVSRERPAPVLARSGLRNRSLPESEAWNCVLTNEPRADSRALHLERQPDTGVLTTPLNKLSSRVSNPGTLNFRFIRLNSTNGRCPSSVTAPVGFHQKCQETPNAAAWLTMAWPPREGSEAAGAVAGDHPPASAVSQRCPCGLS